LSSIECSANQQSATAYLIAAVVVSSFVFALAATGEISIAAQNAAKQQGVSQTLNPAFDIKPPNGAAPTMRLGNSSTFKER